MTIQKKYDIIIRMKQTVYFWLSFALVIILAVYFSVRTITTFSGRGPVSHIHNITIVSDTNDKNLSNIQNAISIPTGATLKTISLSDINNQILSVPTVNKSSVRRMPNGNLSIKVSTHQAVALWTDGVYYYPLSADGDLVKQPTEHRNIDNIVFRGELPDDISNITKQAHKLLGYIDYLEFIENRRWNIHTSSGIIIMLPEENYTTAINTIVSLHNNYRLLDKELQTIDMRDSSRILVK